MGYDNPIIWVFYINPDICCLQNYVARDGESGEIEQRLLFIQWKWPLSLTQPIHDGRSTIMSGQLFFLTRIKRPIFPLTHPLVYTATHNWFDIFIVESIVPVRKVSIVQIRIVVLHCTVHPFLVVCDACIDTRFLWFCTLKTKTHDSHLNIFESKTVDCFFIQSLSSVSCPKIKLSNQKLRSFFEELTNDNDLTDEVAL